MPDNTIDSVSNELRTFERARENGARPAQSPNAANPENGTENRQEHGNNASPGHDGLRGGSSGGSQGADEQHQNSLTNHPHSAAVKESIVSGGGIAWRRHAVIIMHSMTEVDPGISKARLIEVKLPELHHIYNSMDPSPFLERDLDSEAEDFIVSWAREYPMRDPLKIVLYLAKEPMDSSEAARMVAESLRNYFNYRAEMTWREVRRLLQEGRTALLIGLVFLIGCQLLAQFVFVGGKPWMTVIREGLSIGGWVAMWRPLEIGLYLWWPLLRLRRVYLKLAEADVELKVLPPKGPSR